MTPVKYKDCCPNFLNSYSTREGLNLRDNRRPQIDFLSNRILVAPKGLPKKDALVRGESEVSALTLVIHVQTSMGTRPACRHPQLSRTARKGSSRRS